MPATPFEFWKAAFLIEVTPFRAISLGQLLTSVTLAPEASLFYHLHDLSRPSEPVWRFLREAVSKYAMAVFHVPQFAQRLPIPQVLIAPSIRSAPRMTSLVRPILPP
jgi:hypothetical protein